MKGKIGNNKGPPSADLLVCFPTRAPLTLMPKPLCSPVRPPESSKAAQSTHYHPHHHRRPASHHHHYRRKRSSFGGGHGQGSPVLWAKNKPMTNDISEPTSPKVTCAGQIKVRPKPNSCKNWQSVMEEIERIHNNRNNKHKKRPAWAEALGFKKDIMQFLTCLRNIRFDFRCFGAFPTSEITSDDDEDDDDEDYQERHVADSKGNDDDDIDNATVFSKWFMVLQENNKEKKNIVSYETGADDQVNCAPPPNALLLMRCRSAPAKSWLEEREEEEKEEKKAHEYDEYDEKQKVVMNKEEKDNKMRMEELEEKEKLVLRYGGGNDFYKFSSDIAKETWVVGGIKDSLSRSRSWKS